MDLFDNRGNEGLKVFEGNAPLSLLGIASRKLNSLQKLIGF